jgi:hypothetical protein
MPELFSIARGTSHLGSRCRLAPKEELVAVEENTCSSWPTLQLSRSSTVLLQGESLAPLWLWPPNAVVDVDLAEASVEQLAGVAGKYDVRAE